MYSLGQGTCKFAGVGDGGGGDGDDGDMVAVMMVIVVVVVPRIMTGSVGKADSWD